MLYSYDTYNIIIHVLFKQWLIATAIISKNINHQPFAAGKYQKWNVMTLKYTLPSA